MGRDQNDIAARIVYHGAGLRLSPAASVNHLTGAAKRVLSNKVFRAGAQRLGEAIRSDAKNSSTVAELEQLASGSHRNLEGEWADGLRELGDKIFGRGPENQSTSGGSNLAAGLIVM
jgi:hypothetical protein